MAEQEQAAAKAPPDKPAGLTAAQEAAWSAASGGDAGWVARRAEIDKEYGTWVATGPIHIGGVLAFTEGHAVPNGHIDKFGLDKREGEDGQPLVVKRDSKAGKELLESIAASARGE